MTARPASTVREVVRSTTRVDWSQFEGRAALRCTIGVAVPLLAGLVLRQPAVGAFGAVGAVSVGFGSFQGAYRSRAGVMVYAAAGMGLAMFVGSIAGHSDIAAIATAALAAFASGMFVALGPAAAFVGLQSVVAVLVASGFPADISAAAVRAALVLAGGLVQTLLVVMVWPLRRFSAERQAIGSVYRSLARYASSIPMRDAAAPEPHTFAAVSSPLRDPQPFARAGDVLVFQALIDEAERIRASLAALATRRRDLDELGAACVADVATAGRDVLAEIASAVENAREPHDGEGAWESLHGCAARMPTAFPVEALLGQLRAAWRTAGVLTAPNVSPSARDRVKPLRRRPPLRDALTTLRANLSPESATFRHAVRLTVTVAVATAIYRLLGLNRGYWIPMTALLVLKPEFYDTVGRGLARIGGTVVGAALATLIVHAFAPGPAALTGLVLVFVWGCYALFRINYGIFAVCVTGYVVFILMLSGVAEMTAATARAAYTLEGGALALIAYGVWPTWASLEARPALAAMLDAHGQYVFALLGAYADPGRIDLRSMAQLRARARLARSNAEAVVERMAREPRTRATIAPRAALGILAALRRHALASLALHAGIELGVSGPVAGMDRFAADMRTALKALADAVRAGAAPAPLPPLREAERALAKVSDTAVAEETDLMVDAVNTVAELLRQPQPDGRVSPRAAGSG